MVTVSPARVTELPVEIFPAEVIEPPVMDMAPAEVMVLVLFMVISLVLIVIEPPETKFELVPFITIVLPVTVAKVALSEPLPLRVIAVLVSVVPLLVMAAWLWIRLFVIVTLMKLVNELTAMALLEIVVPPEPMIRFALIATLSPEKSCC